MTKMQKHWSSKKKKGRSSKNPDPVTDPKITALQTAIVVVILALMAAAFFVFKPKVDPVLIHGPPVERAVAEPESSERTLDQQLSTKTPPTPPPIQIALPIDRLLQVKSCLGDSKVSLQYRGKGKPNEKWQNADLLRREPAALTPELDELDNRSEQIVLVLSDVDLKFVQEKMGLRFVEQLVAPIDNWDSIKANLPEDANTEAVEIIDAAIAKHTATDHTNVRPIPVESTYSPTTFDDIQPDDTIFTYSMPAKIDDVEAQIVVVQDSFEMTLACLIEAGEEGHEIQLRLPDDCRLQELECRLIQIKDFSLPNGETNQYQRLPEEGKDSLSFLRSNTTISLSTKNNVRLGTVQVKGDPPGNGMLCLPSSPAIQYSYGQSSAQSPDTLEYFRSPPRLERRQHEQSQPLVSRKLDLRLKKAQDEVSREPIDRSDIAHLYNDEKVTGFLVEAGEHDVEYFPIRLAEAQRAKQIEFRPRKIECKFSTHQSENSNKRLQRPAISSGRYKQLVRIGPVERRGDHYNVVISLPPQLANIRDVPLTITIPGYKEERLLLHEFYQHDGTKEIAMTPLIQNVVILVPAAKLFKRAFETDENGIRVQPNDDGTTRSAIELIQSFVRVLSTRLRARLQQEGLPHEVDIFAVLPDRLHPLTSEVRTHFENGGDWWSSMLFGSQSADPSVWRPYNTGHTHSDRFGPNTTVIALLAGIQTIDARDQIYSDQQSRSIERLHITLFSHEKDHFHKVLAEFCEKNSDSTTFALNPTSLDAVNETAEETTTQIVNAIKDNASSTKPKD